MSAELLEENEDAARELTWLALLARESDGFVTLYIGERDGVLVYGLETVEHDTDYARAREEEV